MGNMLKQTTEGLMLEVAGRFGSLTPEGIMNRDIFYAPIDIALKLSSQDTFFKKHLIVDGDENMIVEFFGNLISLSNFLHTVS